MLKKLLLLITLILSLLVVSCENVVLPDDLEACNDLKFESVLGGYEVVGIGDCKHPVVIIPNTYNGKKVVSIGKKAFKDCDQIVTVVIPKNVKTVKSEAFVGCEYLNTVYIEHGVEKLQSMLFYSGNGSLTFINTEYSIYYQGTSAEFKKLNSPDYLGGLSRPWFYSGYETIIFKVYCTDGYLVYNYHELSNSPKWNQYEDDIECPYHVDNNKDYICDNCKKTLPGFSHKHTEVTDTAISATCTTTGLTEGKHCSSCGEVIIAQQTIAKKDHTDSNKDYICDICRTVLPGSHTHTVAIMPPELATCTKTGLSLGQYCSTCNEIIVAQQTIAKLNHVESDWNITKEPTNTAAGKKQTVCIYCDEVIREESIPKIDGSLGLEYKLSDDGKSYSVNGIGSCKDTSIIIPSNYYGLPVTSIGFNAFSNCSSIKSITIPNTVKTIGTQAFHYCTSLKTISFGSGITDIEINAFYGCAFTELNLPNSLKTIGYSAFADCSNLKKITIPASVTSIGERAFVYSNLLQSIEVNSSNSTYKSINGVLYTKNGDTLIWYPPNKQDSAFVVPNGVKYILDEACLAANFESVTLPDGLKTIGYNAFTYCYSLKTVTIPASVTSIGFSAFGCNWDLESINVKSGNTVYKSIDGNLYSKDGKTLITYASGKINTEFTIPDTVTTIEKFAFADSRNLESVVIGSNVKEIPGDAFNCCTSLTYVTIPTSVIKIDYNAFRYTNLEKITYQGTVAQWKSISMPYDDWDADTPNYKINCTDGILSK